MVVGKCLCGTGRYAVEGPFRYAGYCHCARCRAGSGSAFSAFAGIEQNRLRVTDGADSIALFEMNPDNIVRFCKLCGSSPSALVRDGQFFSRQAGNAGRRPGHSPVLPHLRGLEGAVARDHGCAPAIRRASACGGPGDLRLRLSRRQRGLNRMGENMALQMARTDEKAEIRGLLEDWAKAARASDIDRIMAAYAPDILSFDAIAQLQFKGAQAYRKHWEACIAMCSGPMIFEIHDLGIEASDDVAFGHYLLKCGGTGPDGKEQVGWMRVTVGCRKSGGRWLVAHEHFSVPFDMESGKALLTLEP